MLLYFNVRCQRAPRPVPRASTRGTPRTLTALTVTGLLFHLLGRAHSCADALQGELPRGARAPFSPVHLSARSRRGGAGQRSFRMAKEPLVVMICRSRCVERRNTKAERAGWQVNTAYRVLSPLLLSVWFVIEVKSLLPTSVLLCNGLTGRTCRSRCVCSLAMSGTCKRRFLSSR